MRFQVVATSYREEIMAAECSEGALLLRNLQKSIWTDIRRLKHAEVMDLTALRANRTKEGVQ
jgi:hypothetical protein